MSVLRRFPILLALAVCASCRPQPTATHGDAAVDSHQADHDSPTPPPTAAPAPDPEALQQSLDAAAGFAVEVRAEQTVAGGGSKSRTYVAFVASGPEFCRHYLPAERTNECVFDGRPGSLPWESLELLGFAVIESELERSLEVRHVRVMHSVGPLHLGRQPHSEPPGESWAAWPRLIPDQSDIGIEHFSVEDVDFDGRVELVVYASYTDVAPEDFGEGDDYEEEGEEDFEPLSVEDATRYSNEAARLMIFREDLSLEFDVDLYQRMIQMDPGGFYDNDIVRSEWTIEKEGVVVYWCEIDPLIAASECSLDILCGSPTHHVVVPYDRSNDSYGAKQVEKLRPVVDRYDYDRCPTLDGGD